jgi:hypothetical protein
MLRFITRYRKHNAYNHRRGYMAIRHIIAAGLVASVSLAQAAPTQNSAGVVAGWTLKAGSVNVLGELDAVQLMLAQGGKAADWNLHTTMAGNNGKAVLYSPVSQLAAVDPTMVQTLSGGGAASAGTTGQGGGQSSGPQGSPVGPNGNGPANPSSLPNGVTTGGHSDPLSVPNSMKGGSSTPDLGAGAGVGAEASAGTTPGSDEIVNGTPAAAQELLEELVKSGQPLVVAVDEPAQANASAVPEPSTNMLMLAALLGGAVLVRRRAE